MLEPRAPRIARKSTSDPSWRDGMHIKINAPETNTVVPWEQLNNIFVGRRNNGCNELHPSRSGR